MEENSRSAEERRQFARTTLTPAARGLSSLREQFGQPLLVLQGIAALVLLIACANVASLLLVRAGARRREMATRVAMGAAPARLIRQMLTESLLLGVLGTLAGLVLASGFTALLTAPLAMGPAPVALDLKPDLRLLGFLVTICVVTSLLFGLAPALRVAQVSAYEEIKQQAATGVARRFGFAAGSGVVVVQIALSLVLLVSAGLLVTTLVRLRAVDVGFRPNGIATVAVDIMPAGLSADPKGRWTEVLTRAEAVPGVDSASLSWLIPFGVRDRGVALRVPSATSDGVPAVLNHVSSDFFTTMGIPLRAGRSFTELDDANAPQVAILNSAAASALFGTSEAIGQQITMGGRPREVVGVVADTVHLSLRGEVPHFAYVPLFQSTERLASLTLAVRSSGEVSALIEPVRRTLRDLRSDVVVGHAATMRQHVDQSLLRERLMSTLSASFGLLGLALTSVGLFSVMSFAVLKRRQEIAVRMALGASGAKVQWQVVNQAVLIAAIGVAVGLPLSLIVARMLTTLLFGVAPMSAPILLACVAMMLVVAGLAAFVPARRASSTNPATILRQ